MELASSSEDCIPRSLEIYVPFPTEAASRPRFPASLYALVTVVTLTPTILASSRCVGSLSPGFNIPLLMSRSIASTSIMTYQYFINCVSTVDRSEFSDYYVAKWNTFYLILPTII